MSAVAKARVECDSTPFEQGMDKVGHIAEKAGHKISKKLDKSFGTGLIAGFVVGTLKDILLKPFEAIPERAAHIAEMSSKLHVTAEEFQILEAAAAKAHMPIEDFVTSITAGNTSLTEAISKLQQYRQQMHLTARDVKSVNDAKSTLGKAGNAGTVLGAKAFNWLSNLVTVELASVENLVGIKHNDAAEQAAWEGVMGMNGGLDTKGEKLATHRRDRLMTQLAAAKLDVENSKGNQNAMILGQSVTSRQQIGAAIGSTPDVIAPLKEINEHQRELVDRVKNIETQITATVNQQ